MSILDYTPPGMPFWVNGVRRQIESIGVVGVEPGTLPVWTVTVDGHLGAGGTLDAALVLAARAAEGRVTS